MQLLKSNYISVIPNVCFSFSLAYSKMAFSSKALIGGAIYLALLCRFAALVDICKEKNKADYNLTLQGAVTFKDYLLLIDSDWLVYNLSYANLENSYGQLLMSMKGTPLTQYWPLFGTNQDWPKIAPTIVDIYHIEKVTSFVYFLSSGSQDGVCYSVEKENWCAELTNQVNKDTRDVMVTDTWEHQYSFQWSKGVIAIYRWETEWFEEGAIVQQKSHFLGYLYYTVNPDSSARNLTLISGHYPAGSKENPCKSNPGYERYQIEQLDWGEEGYLPRAFVYKNYFYIYAQKDVFIIEDVARDLPNHKEDDAEDKIRASAPVKTIKVKDYFACNEVNNFTYPSTVEHHTDDGKQWNKSHGGFPWWAWAIPLIVIIVCLLALAVWFVFFRNEQDEPKDQEKSHPKESSSKGKESRPSQKDGGKERPTSSGLTKVVSKQGLKQQASAKQISQITSAKSTGLATDLNKSKLAQP